MISFLRNLYYKIRYWRRMDDARIELDEWAASLKIGKLPTFKIMMSQFKWYPDGRFDWVPDSPEIVVARGWKDDCDGAAVLAKWGFKKIGMPCHIYRLSGKNGAHAVTVTDDHKYFTSNSSVVEILEPKKWQKYILLWNWHRSKNYLSIERYD